MKMKPPSKQKIWGKPQWCLPEYGIDNNGEGVSYAIPPDGSALSIHFDAMTVELGKEEEGLVASKTLSVLFPLELPNEDFLGFVCSISGHLSSSSGGRAVLLADICGESHFREYDYPEVVIDATSPDQQGDGDDGSTQDRDQVLGDSWFSLQQRSKVQDGGKPAPMTPAAITLLLTAQRKTTEDYVNISVGSIDIAIRFLKGPEA